LNPLLDPNDPNTWPVVDAVPSDVFLGEFVHDCTPHLTDEQKAWPVVQCEPTDVFLGVFPQSRPTQADADQVQPPSAPCTPPLNAAQGEQQTPPPLP
jgi:hypothetical protein